MKNNKNIFFGLAMLVMATIAGGWVYNAYNDKSKVKVQENTTRKAAEESVTAISTVETMIPPCTMMRAPDGSMVSVCSPTAVVFPPDVGGVVIAEPRFVSGPNGSFPAILSAGIGTTTMKKATPFNDILIAESGSPYATLRNARYTVWPYPGEVALKEVYIVLPEMYDPIFPGYSDKQFIESTDGTKHVMIYLRHKQSATVGADAKVFVQSPIMTDEQDHSLTLFESTSKNDNFSIIRNGKEVIVEVSFMTSSNVSPELLAYARKELLRAVGDMEIIW